jgi:hypothetical protein
MVRRRHRSQTDGVGKAPTSAQVATADVEPPVTQHFAASSTSPPASSPTWRSPARSASKDQSVIEQLFRLETAAGNTLEQLLAAELGRDTSHRIR